MNAKARTVVVVGLGSMGKRRIRILKKLMPNDCIIGIDSNEDRKKQTFENYGIETISSLDELDDANNGDCAFVCTSPLAHASIISECLNKNYNVFTEINLVSDMYQQNIKMANDKNLVLFLSSTPIYREEMKSLHNEISSIDKPVNYIYHVGQYLPDWHPWESYNSFFVGDKRTNGCREIMAIELPWMIRTFGEIKNVSVYKTKMTQLNIDYNDSYVINIDHANGTHGVFIVDVVSRKAVRRLEVYNEDLYIEWSGTPESLKKKDIKSGEMQCIAKTDYKRDADYSEFVNELAYVSEVKEFFNVLNGSQAKYSFSDDLSVLNLIDDIEGAI